MLFVICRQMSLLQLRAQERKLPLPQIAMATICALAVFHGQLVIKVNRSKRYYYSRPLSICLKTISLHPFTAKGDLIDFTLSNARRYYSSKGDPLAVSQN